jgi:hypothetical protein
VRDPRAAGTIGLACTGFAAQAFACAGEFERAREVLGHVLSVLDGTEPLEPGTSGMVSLATAAVWESAPMISQSSCCGTHWRSPTPMDTSST